MIWVDREVKRLKERKFPLEWVDDMKTPSGRIHVGSLRGVIIHDLLYKALLENGVNAKYSYVFNNMDPMDSIPSYLDQKIWGKYSGQPLCKIPSPEKGFGNFGEYYAKEFIEVFNLLNCYPQIIWSSDLYKSGKMNDSIKLFLDNADKVRDIYKRVAHAERDPDWIPFNPICEKCGNIGTTNSYKWDGEQVYYRCNVQVTWAKGCGYDGKILPYNGNGKLPWKLDWPAHWASIGITIESSGKDHMSSGGSYDMASHFCREILKIEPADAIGGYEWFVIAGRKMSSSKGIGTSAKEVFSILPPEVFRFLLVRTPINTHLDFNPYGETIPRLFDDYDRCLNAYFDKLENKLPAGKQGEVMEDYARIAYLSQVTEIPKKRIVLPRFRTVVNLLKNKQDVYEYFKEKSPFLDERIAYAKIYLEKYDNKSQISEVKSQNFSSNEKQKVFLIKLTNNLSDLKNKDEIQQAVFNSIKQTGIKPKEAFTAFYQALTGKDFGPKAADLIMSLSVPKVINFIQSYLDNKEVIKFEKYLFEELKDNKIFSIDPQVSQKYPSITIGIAIIKGVNIQRSNPQLQKEINDFLATQSDLTNEMISSYPQVQSYRKLYKEMGVDWHSRRPSPEALLRRIIQKKGLYNINTCVDAYNLVVMKNMVSSGAFDLDKIEFPTVLRFPKEGEKILLLGDKEPTEYKSTELAYFDQNGGYNIDFNYRDSQQTAVTENTKNILINIDGIYDITRKMVEKTLKETLEIITKYCRGKVEIAEIK